MKTIRAKSSFVLLFFLVAVPFVLFSSGAQKKNGQSREVVRAEEVTDEPFEWKASLWEACKENPNSQLKQYLVQLEEFRVLVLDYLGLVLDCPELNFVQKQCGRELLEEAINYDHAEGVEELLKKQVDPNQIAKFGRPALISAAYVDGAQGTIELLLKYGVNVYVKDSNNGYTPLIISAGYCNVEMAKLFLDSGVQVDQQDNDGRTALMHIIKKSFQIEGSPHLDLIRMLCERGANPNIKDNDGKNSFDLVEMEKAERKIKWEQDGKKWDYSDREGYLGEVKKLLTPVSC